MATKKKSKNNTTVDLKNDNIESTSDVEQKIELISSTDPNINTFTDDLQSEIDLFESELDETIEEKKLELVQSETEPTSKSLEPEKIDSVKPDEEEHIASKEVDSVQLENEELEKVESAKTKKPKKTRSRKSKKTADTEKTESGETTKPKKTRTRKSKTQKEAEKTEIKEPEPGKEKEPEKVETENPSEKVQKEKVKEPIKNVVNEEIIDINQVTESISDSKIQASVLVLYNEKAELQANLEKSKKILRILKKKLDLAEEKGEQWKACAYTLGDFFASKSNMPLEDVLRRFEAPIDEEEL